MATNPQVQRQRQLTPASPVVTVPEFPLRQLIAGLGLKERSAIRIAEQALEDHRQKLQHSINQALLNR